MKTLIASWLGGWLWIIPLLTLVGAIIYMVIAYKASKSGSQTQDLQKGVQYSDENIPIYKLGQFKFSVALFIVTGIILLLMYSDR